MYEAIKEVQKIMKQFNGVYGIQNNTLVISDFRDSISCAMENIQSTKNIIDNMKKTLGVDWMVSMKQMQDNYSLISQSAIGIFPKVLSNATSFKENFSYINNAKKILNSYADVLSAYRVHQDVLQKWRQLYDSLSKVNEECYKSLLNGTNYTKEDILQESKEFINEITEIEPTNTEEGNAIERYLKDIRKKCPPLDYLITIIQIVIFLSGGYQVMNDNIRPLCENAIVKMEGNSSIYIIRTEKAKIYSNPSSRPVVDGGSGGSVVLGYAYYGEQVEILKEIKMWGEVSYTDSSGKTIIGWIAKRNLLPYEEYQFHSDNL